MFVKVKLINVTIREGNHADTDTLGLWLAVADVEPKRYSLEHVDEHLVVALSDGTRRVDDKHHIRGIATGWRKNKKQENNLFFYSF